MIAPTPTVTPTATNTPTATPVSSSNNSSNSQPSTPTNTPGATSTGTPAVTATSTSTPTSTATIPPPNHNLAPRFYGQQDIVIGHSAAQAIGQAMQNYTVELSARPDATQHANASIIDAHTGGSGWTLKQAGTATNQYTWAVFTSGGSAQTKAFAIPAGGWHHVAITYRGSTRTVTVFVDGQQVASQPAFPDPAPPLGSMYFARGTGGGGYWSGMLQYIRFSNVVRYPAGVASVPSGVAGFAERGHAAAYYFGREAQVVTFAPPLGPFEPDPAAIAVWNLDEGTGTTAVDVGANHFSGSFEGYLQEPIWVDRLTGLPPASASAPAAPSVPSSGVQVGTSPATAVRPGTSSGRSVQQPSSLPTTGGGGLALLQMGALVLLVTGVFAAIIVRLRRQER